MGDVLERDYMLAYLHICVFHVFSGLGTFQGPGSNPKAVFLIKCYIITVIKFFVECFVPKNGVPKNGFPIVFSKSDFLPKFSCKSKTPRNVPNF